MDYVYVLWNQQYTNLLMVTDMPHRLGTQMLLYRSVHVLNGLHNV